MRSEFIFCYILILNTPFTLVQNRTHFGYGHISPLSREETQENMESLQSAIDNKI